MHCSKKCHLLWDNYLSNLEYCTMVGFQYNYKLVLNLLSKSSCHLKCSKKHFKDEFSHLCCKDSLLSNCIPFHSLNSSSLHYLSSNMQHSNFSNWLMKSQQPIFNQMSCTSQDWNHNKFYHFMNYKDLNLYNLPCKMLDFL